MTKALLAIAGIIGTAIGAAACGTEASQSPSPLTLKPIATIGLPRVNGRIDHLAYEPRTQRLFVAALGNDTIEVINAAANSHLRSLTGFHEPQGIAVVPDPPAIAVANGQTGTLQLVDANSFQTKWTVNVGGDADNVRYDTAAKRLYAAAQGGLYAVDPAAGKVVGRIAIDGHPESFQLEAAGARVYANLPGILSSQLVAGDRATMGVAARWSSLGCGGNYPMALDETTMRVFIGCRRPARLAMFDTRSGMMVASTDIVGDTDDLFFDVPRQRLYVIGGDGFVDVLRRQGDTLAVMGRVATRGGARTGLWVAAQNRLFVAVPARAGQGAEIRVFEGVN
jgi:DNA-binding beta-propeller fold protein YncE